MRLPFKHKFNIIFREKYIFCPSPMKSGDPAEKNRGRLLVNQCAQLGGFETYSVEATQGHTTSNLFNLFWLLNTRRNQVVNWQF